MSDAAVPSRMPRPVKVHDPVDPAENRKENLIAITVVVILLAAVGWWIYSAMNEVPAESDRWNVPAQGAPQLGDGPVVVVEFSDFECPFCADFAIETAPTVVRLAQDGRITFAYRHFPLTQVHPKAYRAAQAAACADLQGEFWEYHDTLYAHQDALEIGDLSRYARELGLNMSQFDRCIETGETASTVQRDMQLGINLGVKGTPVFYFNGRRVQGKLTPEQFEAEVAAEESLS